MIRASVSPIEFFHLTAVAGYFPQRSATGDSIEQLPGI